MSNLKPLGIYIHIPFCIRKCKYCDFLSFVSDDETMETYVESLCKEIQTFFQKHKDYEVKSIYLGGGTPSILKLDLTRKIFDTLHEIAVIASDAEISTEANPGTLDMEKLLTYRECGINRLSMGLQSTVPEELHYLGRIHTYEDFLESYRMAKEAGFDNINIDLMSAVPYQTLDSWAESLERVLALEPAHISAYSLIVEEGTPFYDDDKLDELIPDEDTERRMYELTEEKLLQHGYYRYEISNYAKLGKECIHNILYWEKGDYIGFGLGAASCMDEMRFKNTDNMKEYCKCPYLDFHDRMEIEKLSVHEQMEETMILGLRMTKGVSFDYFKKRYGQTMETVFGDVIEKHTKDGLLIEENGFLRFTKRGLDLSNIVLCDFLS